MQVYVINLSEREDRRNHINNTLDSINFEYFTAVNGKNYNAINVYNEFKLFNRWIDPLLYRKINRGEIGTSISHFKLWEKIAISNEPAIILEDDITLTGVFDKEEINRILQEYDMVYLGYTEMCPDNIKLINEKLIKPYYPYVTSSYAITPRFARKLIESKFKDNLIPVDEYFAIVNGVDFNTCCLSDDSNIVENFLHLSNLLHIPDVKISAYRYPVFKQVPREILGSDIETPYSVTFHFATVATDESKADMLIHSASRNGIKIINLGAMSEWKGGDMAAGPGGGQKINHVKKYLKEQHVFEDDLIGFFDGYDVLINEELHIIYERFKEFNCDILFAAEKICWPDSSLESLFTSHTDYRFLNSGCYIGYKWALDKFFEKPIEDSADDQLYCQHRMLEFANSKELVCKLDNENYIFQCCSGASQDITILNKQLVNLSTKTCPCILHGNGGMEDKKVFKNIFDTLYPTAILKFNNFKIREVERDIIHSKFLTLETCRELINIAEADGRWQALKYDTFPAQEIRIRDLSVSLFNALEEYLMKVVSPQIEKYWLPLLMYGLRDAFIIKYSPETQSSLSCHHDASLVSGIVKLNEDYEGGDTYFYRQAYSNKDVPVGDIILWPGQVTHGHEGRPVTKGTKYNLVIWTSRYEGDVNF